MKSSLQTNLPSNCKSAALAGPSLDVGRRKRFVSRFVWINVLVLFWCAVYFGSPDDEASQEQTSPRLITSRKVVDLGQGSPGSLIRGNFLLQNPGDVSIAFRIHPSCGCTELKPQSGVIEGGEFQRIAVAIRLGKNPEVRNEVRLLVRSRPTSPDLPIQIVASTSAPFRVNPQIVVFSNVPEGESRRVRLRLSTATGRSIRGHAISWTCSSAKVVVTDVVTDLAREGHQWPIDVLLRKDAGRGPIASILDISVKGIGKVAVPIRGQIVGPFDIIPPVVFLPRAIQSEQPKPLQIRIRRWNGEPVPKIASIAVPNGMVVHPRVMEHGKILRLQVTGRLPEKASRRGEIRLTLAGVNETLQIPLREFSP